MFDRLVERLCVQTLAPEGRAAVSQFQDIVIQDGSSFALRAHDPGVRAAWVDGKRLALPKPVWLSRFIAQNLTGAWISTSSTNAATASASAWSASA
jgi:hypothetical protein